MLILTYDELIRRYKKIFNYNWARTNELNLMISRLYDSDYYKINEYFVTLYDVN